jgi:hypothetical protein
MSMFDPPTPVMGGPPTPPTHSPTPSEPVEGLVVIGYIMAVLIPLAGFILGIVVATRPSKETSTHGPWIIAVSVVVFIVCLAILMSLRSAPTYSSY